MLVLATNRCSLQDLPLRRSYCKPLQGIRWNVAASHALWVPPVLFGQLQTRYPRLVCSELNLKPAQDTLCALCGADCAAEEACSRVIQKLQKAMPYSCIRLHVGFSTGCAASDSTTSTSSGKQASLGMCDSHGFLLLYLLSLS